MAAPFKTEEALTASDRQVKLFVCGDVMTGRGIDQILPHASDPTLHEGYLRSAVQYVNLAERVNGRIPKAVPYFYIWGDGLEALVRSAPDVRIINLETSVTTSDQWLPKGINYRMHPANVPCLTAAKIDCCVLANNHILDWGCAGLADTLAILRNAQIQCAGAGRFLAEAESPAILQLAQAVRVLVFAVAAEDSGVPENWAAAEHSPGVAFLPEFSPIAVDRLACKVRAVKRPGDVVVLSIHWGGNWGYTVPPTHRWFAHAVLDYAGVDMIHGHSSHHPRGIEVYNGKLILYGCGDLINDYEGIGGYEEFRSELVLMYLVTLEPSTRRLIGLTMLPFEMKRFHLQRASREDAEWLCDTLNCETPSLGTRLSLQPDQTITLDWC